MATQRTAHRLAMMISEDMNIISEAISVVLRAAGSPVARRVDDIDLDESTENIIWFVLASLAQENEMDDEEFRDSYAFRFCGDCVVRRQGITIARVLIFSYDDLEDRQWWVHDFIILGRDAKTLASILIHHSVTMQNLDEIEGIMRDHYDDQDVDIQCYVEPN